MTDLPETGPMSAPVRQAQGMVSVQADCSLAEAFDLLRERSFALDQPLEVTALGVIDRVIRFDR
jgi:hypothetical protein